MDNIGQQKKENFFSLSVKIRGDSYHFDIAESEYDDQIALLPTSVK
jgi:hypothetical protein